jgi:phosphate transport system substrate-binding protein
MQNPQRLFQRGLRRFHLLAWCGSLLFGLVVSPLAASALTGRIVIAGYGPEQQVMLDLARAYEKLHPGTAIDVEWDKTVRAAEMVKTGEAQIAVTDRADPSLDLVPLAWDGIAVITNFANPLTDLRREQVQKLFTDQLKRWSEVDGADQPVEIIGRTGNANLTAGFETSLGIAGRLVQPSTTARSDQQVLRLVSGRNAAVSYMSLGAALRAQEDGIPIRILSIDGIEPGEPTVANGRYPLKRPVLLLTATKADPLTASFLSFIQSTAGQGLIHRLYTPLGSSPIVSSPSSTQSKDTSRPGT